MLRCNLFYAKIMQVECRISSLLEYYAEMPLILCKNTSFYVNLQINNVTKSLSTTNLYFFWRKTEQYTYYSHNILIRQQHCIPYF